MDIKSKIDYSYEIIKNIGTSKNSGLFLILCDLNKTGGKNYYLLNKFEINNINEIELINHINKIKSINCKYVIKIYDLFIEKKEQKKYLCILTDYYEKGNLSKLISQKEILDSRFIWRIFIQLIFGLNSLHTNDLIAKNLSPQNIYIDNKNNVIINELGISLNNNKEKDYSLFLYISPEIINEQEYDQKSDVWSLGCILYELITKKKPFYLTENILKINYNKSLIMNNDFEYLLSKLLSFEKKRFSINQILKDRIIGIRIMEENLFDEENIKGK